MVNTKRKASDGDAAGGPAGITGRGPERTTEDAIDLADAEILHDLYLRGGAAKPIQSRKATNADVVRLRQAGLITSLLGVRGETLVQLSPRGLQILPRALTLIAARPGALAR